MNNAVKRPTPDHTGLKFSGLTRKSGVNWLADHANAKKYITNMIVVRVYIRRSHFLFHDGENSSSILKIIKIWADSLKTLLLCALWQ